MGNVDAGKSSFIGVMEKNVLDDGNGYARSLITRIQHERDTGRTSTHSPHYLVNNGKITTLIDLCGHEKYLKTTMFGVMGLFGDYGLIMIGANSGITGMTTEHIALLVANKIPFMVILTKIDLCPPNILAIVKKDLERIAKRNRKEIFYFEDDQPQQSEMPSCIIEAFSERNFNVMPVIMVSNKTGHNINFTRSLLTSIKPNLKISDSQNHPVMYIDSIFSVQGIGIVLSGTVKFGSIHLGQKVLIGPVNRTYVSVTIKSIHNCVRDPISILNANETGSIGIRLDTKGSYSREMFKKGQVAITDLDFAMKHTCLSFNCDVAIFNHPTTIRNGYQTVIHAGTVRQTAKFKIDSEKILRTNSKENIGVKFVSRPEFILPGTLFMFRDGRTKGMGRVISITPFSEDTFEPITKSGSRSRRTRSERKKLLETK